MPGVIQPKLRPNVRAHTTAGACLQGLATGFLKFLCQILSDNVFLLPHLPSTERRCLDILEHLNQAFLHLFWDIISVHFVSFKTPAGRSQVAPAKLTIATELFTWPQSTAMVHLAPRKCPLYGWEVPQCPSLCSPSGHAISSPFFTETLFLSSDSTLCPLLLAQPVPCAVAAHHFSSAPDPLLVPALPQLKASYSTTSPHAQVCLCE